jgi:hypothetical protein
MTSESIQFERVDWIMSRYRRGELSYDEVQLALANAGFSAEERRKIMRGEEP